MWGVLAPACALHAMSLPGGSVAVRDCGFPPGHPSPPHHPLPTPAHPTHPHLLTPTCLGSMGMVRVAGSCSRPSAYLLTARSSCQAAMSASTLALSWACAAAAEGALAGWLGTGRWWQARASGSGLYSGQPHVVLPAAMPVAHHRHRELVLSGRPCCVSPLGPPYCHLQAQAPHPPPATTAHTAPECATRPALR